MKTLKCGSAQALIRYFYKLARVVFVVLLFSSQLGCSNPVAFAPTPNAALKELSGTQKTEVFTQDYVSKKLDIIFVVDNSGSMADEQRKMGDRISNFISTLYDVDWQIAITTTDVSDGVYGLKGDFLTIAGTNGFILTPQTPNYLSAFQNTIVRPESYNCTGGCPSGDEQALRAAMMAIDKRDTSNKGFFRNGADLGLLVLSDEDEMSSGPSQATHAEELLSQIDSIWQDSKQFFSFGVVIQPGDTNCLSQQGGAGHYGTFVSHLVDLTGGLTGSICDTDYAPTLGLIGDHARHLLDNVLLKYTPVPDSVAVRFTPDFSSSISVSGRRVYLNPPPPKSTMIEVLYTIR